MSIEERIKQENERHNEEIKRLNDILKMYDSDGRDIMKSAERNADEAARYGIDPDEIIAYEESRQYINPYEKQMKDIQNKIEEENLLHKKNMSDLEKEKEKIVYQSEINKLAKEKEKLQEEIELNKIKIELERIKATKYEIDNRIKTITLETLGQYYSKRIEKEFPEIYQRFQETKEQVKGISNKNKGLFSLKTELEEEKIELKKYQEALPIYEEYYNKYKEIQKMDNEKKAEDKKQKDIYNLIYSEENERLKKGKSLYTAWDLSNKIIPPEFQGMTYEEVDAVLKQKQKEEAIKKQEKTVRDELTDLAIRKKINVPSDYHLTDIQVKNLSKDFEHYSNEELKDYINNGKIIERKEDKTPDKDELISRIIGSLSEFELKFIPSDIKDRLNDMSSEKLKQFSKSKKLCLNELIPPARRAELIGYTLISLPDFNKLTEEQKSRYNNAFGSFTNEQLFKQYSINMENNKEKRKDDDRKKELIDKIIRIVYEKGGLNDYSFLPDIRKGLMEKTVEELEKLLDDLQPKDDQMNFNSRSK